MGKLIEKLHEVTQASSSGMGFFGRGRAAEHTARPAMLLAAGGRDDMAALRAAVENGADGVMLADWSAGGAGFADLAAALRAGAAIWGIRLDSGYTEGTLKAAQTQGAAFAVVGPELPASALFEELDGFDLVVTVEPPRDDLALLSLRAVNLLPAQAALLDARFTAAGLARLSIADFTRLQLVRESMRFPALVTLQGAPEAGAIRTLVQLGADALVVAAAGNSATAFGQQVKAMRADLAKTPARRDREGAPLLGGLLGSTGSAAGLPGPRPRPDQPERDPDEE